MPATNSKIPAHCSRTPGVRLPHTSRSSHARLYKIFAWFLALVMAISPALGSSAKAAQSASPPPAARGNIAPQSGGSSVAPTDVVWPAREVRTQPVVVERGAFHRVERNPDGTFVSVHSQRPMHWREPKTQEWKQFDNKLQPVKDPGAQQDFGAENASNGYRVRFAKAASVAAGRPAVSFEANGASVSMAPRGARPASATVSGAQITYTIRSTW